MMQVIIGEEQVNIEQLDDSLFTVNGKEESLDIESLGDNLYSVIRNHKTYLLEVLDINQEKSTMTLKINDKTQKILVKDQYDILLDSLGMTNGVSKKIKELRAPMPGMVIEVLTEEGNGMDKGASLLILEAMKMENIIKSPEAVVIDKIHVKAGDSVDKNQVLISFG